MSVRPIFLISALAAAAAACAPTPPVGGYGAPAAAVFKAEDFAWSQRAGPAAIDGRVDYRRDGRAYACTGSAGLTPDTPYTRQRFAALYGSTDRAAVPEAVVRARNVPDPNADYRAYVRSERCENGRFRFSDLPDGGWFVIVPVSTDGDRVVLMRFVQTRGGRVTNVVM